MRYHWIFANGAARAARIGVSIVSKRRKLGRVRGVACFHTQLAHRPPIVNHEPTLPGPVAVPTDLPPHACDDDGALLSFLKRAIPDAALRRTILTDNPARLYDFPA